MCPSVALVVAFGGRAVKNVNIAPVACQVDVEPGLKQAVQHLGHLWQVNQFRVHLDDDTAHTGQIEGGQDLGLCPLYIDDQNGRVRFGQQTAHIDAGQADS